MRVLRTSLLGGISVALLAAGFSAATASEAKFFKRIATMPVYETLAQGVDRKSETVAEIIAASEDGMTIAFTDGPQKEIVVLDASNAAQPKPAGRTALGGEPTSVAISGKYALAGVNTSESYTKPSGYLAVIDLVTKQITAKCDVKGQPDSVAVSKDGKFLAIAIENERDEGLNDGALPQLPAGFLTIFDLDENGMPTNCDAVRTVEMTGLAAEGGDDPEPEYVAINSKGEAVVTLQENNYLVLVDLASGKIINHFSAGTATAKNVPVKKARLSDASGSKVDIPREPDAVAWIDDNRFVTANEGDYKGGSRGFTIWNKDGTIEFDSGNRIEHLAMSHGHYPAKRAHKKGTEPEGVTVGKFGGETLIFVNSERGNFVAVYRDTGAKPEFVQFLPTHIGPEGLLAIPSRNLFVVANEKDNVEDKVRAHVGLYEFGATSAEYPQLVSNIDPETNAPIGWGAISGMVADKDDANKLYAVSDSFYDKARIFTLDVSKQPVEITGHMDLTGGTAKKYDLEGIALRKDGGFWLASEGNAKKEMEHFLLQASANGEIQKEIKLPASLIAQAKRFSLEGVAEFEMNGKTLVAVAVQREWNDDPKGMTKIGIYNPADESWGFVHYPLDAPRSSAGGWVGLSEITALGNGKFAVLERDNKGGKEAAIKQVTTISLQGITPAPHGTELPVLTKKVVLDLLPAMSATNGWTPDKVEGLAITKDGRILVSTDNDGVDDASGESLFFSMGSAAQLN
ncbi:esterase-like activity of phytase family protein [Pseudovibrio brasiliensis]|uniref:Esterase-like activity of phytase family protein n=1 Tax=Pseudovibrio brasiliensis TaxID=1898042 RepID=A0ABX8APA9_9HYPH|nr:esterase-like activity of phytase family protein [Pseudovibrio brasiliensis]QUS55546.1 esterase-like activity of phytase family protein [Pseudovibrio brasiliensis]